MGLAEVSLKGEVRLRDHLLTSGILISLRSGDRGPGDDRTVEGAAVRRRPQTLQGYQVRNILPLN